MRWGAFEGLKHTNIYVLNVPEREMREKEAEKLFQEIMTENILNAMQNINLSIKKHNELKVAKCKEIPS